MLSPLTATIMKSDHETNEIIKCVRTVDVGFCGDDFPVGQQRHSECYGSNT